MVWRITTSYYQNRISIGVSPNLKIHEHSSSEGQRKIRHKRMSSDSCYREKRNKSQLL